MEIIWKWSKLLIALSFVGFCKGFPLNLEDNTGNTQFLTGIAAVLITVGIVILAGCLCCQRHNGFQEFQNSAVAVSVASNLEHGHVNSITNGEFTIFTPLNPSHLDNNLFHSNIQISARTPEEIDGINIKKWFDNTKEDFPRVKLKYIRELGSGRFGKVVEGAARDLDLDPNRVWTPVVVRILDAASTMQERVLFLNDALFYLAPSHPHILALKGQCLSTVPLLLLQELCTGGDLKARLRSRGDENNSLLWCCQLTSALRHLHDNGFIHPDLAARNCLLTDNLTLKLGDYGLSASKYPGDYYKGGEPLIPVRWRAPESLECTSTTIKPKPLTKEANIWSLGVVMWEICENGSQPYGFLDDDEVISRVFSLEGLRLDGPSKPQLYSDYIFRLIKMCWNTAESRPKITQIDMMLSDLLQVHKHSLEPLVNSDFDRRWESFKPNTIVKTDNYNEESILKSTSLSLNNLHGSLDNLMSDQLSAGQLDFKLGPSGSMSNKKSSSPADDSLNDSFIFKQQGSSGSDTEEENWRKKVERGAYSEKVRIKSRSVADLMVLTHVDYPESDTETPMQSMDFKPNRGLRKSNLENSSLNFNSEGNLLSLEDTFEQELTKLRVDRRDSALFVPENKSETNSNLNLLQELNSPLELKAMNPIYTIFNMTIDNFNEAKLHDIIALGDEDKLFSRQDSENKSDLGYATLHNSERNSDFGSVDGEHLLEDGIGFIKLEIEEKLKNCELLNKDDYPEFSDKTFVMNENLPDVLPSSVCNPERMNLDLLESNSLKRHGESSFPKTVPKLSDLVLNNYKLMHLVKDIPSESHQVPDHLPCENLETSVNLLNEKNEDTTQDILPLMSTLTESDARQTFAETIKFLDEERRNCENYLEISTKSELLPDPLNERISLVDNDQSTSVENSPKVAFDLSENQQEIKPNSLTHNAVFTSTPFGKIQKVPMCIRPSLNLFPNDQQDYEERNMFSSNFFPLEPNGDDPDEENRLNYSLETWDNFLKNSFDINNREPHENFFDSFSSDPQSMLFVEDDMDKITNSQDELNHSVCGETFVKNEEPNKDGTFVLEKCNKTFNLEDRKNGTFKVEEHDNEEGHFEPSGGWFLHPQSNNDQLTGDIDPQPSTSTGSYIKFGVDDELMTALRNELLEKLPQAQSACQENVQESETWNPIERNEVFLRYNVYNPPLSPIPEESSCLEEDELIVKTNKSPRQMNINHQVRTLEACVTQ
ncbi:hypothetical protein ABEB36_006685 [Hypothenemus hampei]|uniref:Protein kinase domain-containing protein n=1 Tax=Hypothenemus hampei TaxID=57062 RepID=A0ABD1ERX8_HYPHA